VVALRKSSAYVDVVLLVTGKDLSDLVTTHNRILNPAKNYYPKQNHSLHDLMYPVLKLLTKKNISGV